MEDSDDSDESEFEIASGSSQDFDHDDIESDEEDHHSVGSREQLDNGLERIHLFRPLKSEILIKSLTRDIAEIKN